MTTKFLPRPKIVMLTFLGIEFVGILKKLRSSRVFYPRIVLLKTICAN